MCKYNFDFFLCEKIKMRQQNSQLWSKQFKKKKLIASEKNAYTKVCKKQNSNIFVTFFYIDLRYYTSCELILWVIMKEQNIYIALNFIWSKNFYLKCGYKCRNTYKKIKI